MTSKTTMPEPVAYPSDDWVEEFFGRPDECGFYVFRGDFGNIADRFRIAAKFAGLITTSQAEAYKDACVKEALEAAAAVAEERSAVLPHYSDFIRGYADGRKAAASEIRALMPPLRGVEQQ